MTERRRQWVRAGTAAAAVLALLVLFAPPGGRVPLDQRLSTMRTSPDGARALHDLLAALDVSVTRRMTPLDAGTPVGGPLALLAPTEPVTPAEHDSLLHWVERGGTVILALSPDDPLLRRLGLDTWFVEDPYRWGRPLPGPWTRGLDSVGPFGQSLVVEPSSPLTHIEPLVLVGADEEPAVLRARLGRGRVVVIADPAVLSNRRIGESGIATLFARIAAAAAAPGRPLTFDEYHHGHRGATPASAFMRFLGSTPPGWLLLQLALVAALAALPSVVRFGAPLPVRPARRRSPLEHVAALGEVYRQARAADLGRRRLLAGFARRLGRERPVPGGEAAFLARIARGSPAAADSVDAVAAAWERRAPVRDFAERIDEALNRLNRTA